MRGQQLLTGGGGCIQCVLQAVRAVAGDELGDGTFLNRGAVFNDVDVVGELLRVINQVRGEHDCSAEFTLFTNDVEDDVAGLRIQACGGLVEEEHVRAADEGGGKGDALLLTTREAANRGAVEGINAEAFCKLFDRVRVGVHGGDVLE